MMEALCRRIGMPEEVTCRLLAMDDPLPDLGKLTREESWEVGLREVQAALGEDPDGMKLLRCMLRLALDARAVYRRLGICDEIYFHTMGCFRRFVGEHLESYGRYGFDRGFWTVRQVSGRLFRIGELEYELIRLDDRPVISLHIPTDVRLWTPLLQESVERAGEVLNRAFPEYRDAPMFCRSWLLSPDLKELLPPDSNILAFQRSFRITPLPTPSTGVILWVFKNPGLSPADYPEDTTLQRNMKAYLLAGETFTDAKGFLRPDPFQ